MRFFNYVLAACLLAITLPAAAFTLKASQYVPVSVNNANRPLAAKMLKHDKGKVEVIEFFSYGCPACAYTNTAIESWLKKHKNNIEFYYIPVVFHPQWQPLAKAFYTAQALGVERKLHSDLFKSIHEDKKKYETSNDLKPFFARYGVAPKKFDEYFDSFSIDQKVIEGVKLMREYEVYRIPTFIIGGRYRTDLSMAKSDTEFIKILEALIQKAG